MQFRQTIIMTQLILLTPILAGAAQELEPTKLRQLVHRTISPLYYRRPSFGTAEVAADGWLGIPEWPQ